MDDIIKNDFEKGYIYDITIIDNVKSLGVYYLSNNTYKRHYLGVLKETANFIECKRYNKIDVGEMNLFIVVSSCEDFKVMKARKFIVNSKKDKIIYQIPENNSIQIGEIYIKDDIKRLCRK